MWATLCVVQVCYKIRSRCHIQFNDPFVLVFRLRFVSCVSYVFIVNQILLKRPIVLCDTYNMWHKCKCGSSNGS